MRSAGTIPHDERACDRPDARARLMPLKRQTRAQRRTTTAPPVVNGVRASAQRYSLKGKKLNLPRTKQWQEDGWAMFDLVGEIKQLTWMQGNALAKLKLYVGVRDPDDPEADPVPITDDDVGIDPAIVKRAQAELARLRGPLGGKSEILRELNMNLEVAGEAFLIGFAANPEADPPTTEEWGVYSTSEVKESDGTVEIKGSSSAAPTRKLDKERDAIIRVWQRHPRYSMDADCALRGVLDDLDTLVALRNQVKATARSKMPAGWITIPNELSMGPSTPTEGEGGEEAATDPFEQELIEAIIEPIEDPGAASAYAPTLLRGPGEFLGPDKVRRITFERTDDATLPEKIEKCLLGIARGLNAPVEEVTGSMETTFSNAAVIKQDKFDEHYEPRAVLIVDALTVGFFLPNMLDTTEEHDAVPVEIAERLCIWYDASDLVVETDLAESADFGLENDALSWDAWRRYKKFSDDDAPDPIEILVKAALRARTFDPGISTALLDLFGVDLDIPDALPGTIRGELVIASGKRSRAKRARRGQHRGRDVGRGLLAIDKELRTRLLTAANLHMTRVLERAGSKLRSLSAQNADLAKGVAAVNVAQFLGHALVADAGVADDFLVPDDAFEEFGRQFRTWSAQAQKQAIDYVDDLIGLTGAQRDALELRQAGALEDAWGWMRDALHVLAQERLYAPNLTPPTIGEFDPTSKIPTGLIRQALARAGGATGLTAVNGDPYVTVNNGNPPGGIGTGELVMTTLAGSDVLVEAYEWVYGPAYRLHPFEDHEGLDAVVFADWDADILTGSPFDANYFPGDHQGCLCDAAPVLALPEDLEE